MSQKSPQNGCGSHPGPRSYAGTRPRPPPCARSPRGPGSRAHPRPAPGARCASGGSGPTDGDGRPRRYAHRRRAVGSNWFHSQWQLRGSSLRFYRGESRTRPGRARAKSAQQEQREVENRPRSSSIASARSPIGFTPGPAAREWPTRACRHLTRVGIPPALTPEISGTSPRVRRA